MLQSLPLGLSRCFCLLCHVAVPWTWGHLQGESRPSQMPRGGSVPAQLTRFPFLTPLMCCTPAGHKEISLPSHSTTPPPRAEGPLPRGDNHQDTLGACVTVGDGPTSAKCPPNTHCGPASLEQRWHCHAEDARGGVHPIPTLPAPASSPHQGQRARGQCGTQLGLILCHHTVTALGRRPEGQAGQDPGFWGGEEEWETRTCPGKVGRR